MNILITVSVRWHRCWVYPEIPSRSIGKDKLFPGIVSPEAAEKNDVITDEVKIFIISCLEADKTAPKKQRHTARRIYERLVSELGFKGCEASVRRTVVELRGKDTQRICSSLL